MGDVTAGDDIDNDGAVTGTISEDANVAKVDLPEVDFDAGGDDIEVPKKGSVSLAPGSYGEVDVNKQGELILSAGDCFMETLILGKAAVLSIDVSGGPVTINVEDKLKFGKKVEVVITPGGEDDTEQVTFNFENDKKVKIGKQARILGSLIAPDATVELQKNSRFKGAICAETIKVKKNVTFLHHSSTTILPKAAPDAEDDDENEEVQVTAVPTEFELHQNYPNPFNPSTTITFAVPQAGEVTLAIYNLRGQLVRTLHAGALAAGRHSMVWDGTDARGAKVASGIYVTQLKAKGFVATRKLLLTKQGKRPVCQTKNPPFLKEDLGGFPATAEKMKRPEKNADNRNVRMGLSSVAAVQVRVDEVAEGDLL